MPLRRTRFTLSAEREIVGTDLRPERVRLSVQFEPIGEPPVEPTPEQLREALVGLRGELDALVGGSMTSPPPVRSLEELVETYRPRQAELVNLLRADGEISPPEAELLLANLVPAAPSLFIPRNASADLPLPIDRPLAAMPLEADRTPSSPRPVIELLERYRIESLRQAGAVRARRQISYEEFMALKRHFGATAPSEAKTMASPPPSSEPHPTDGR